MYGTINSTAGWFPCGACNCPTGECLNRRSTQRASASTTFWTITVPAETEQERELRELTEGLTKAFAWRRVRTREGWVQSPSVPPRPPKTVQVSKDFQRRPGRPSRFRGHGGPRPLRSRPSARARL